METLILNSNSKKDLELIKEIALKFGISVSYGKAPDETEEQRKERLLALAKRLDASVKPNDITMEEIVEECNIVRKELYEKRKNNS